MAGSGAVLDTFELGSQWPTLDPFLFCVHHDDAYPEANGGFGPGRPLDGRQLGSDFSSLDGWSMYHGRLVPGFPQHPHRGFETITFVRAGLVDHADSAGAAARYGQGDVQWMTAGGGIVHSEMFPLLDARQPNPLELFQIWMNLPSDDKMVEPHFSMLWASEIPRHLSIDDDGHLTEVTIVAGELAGLVPPGPPPHSWASRPDSDVAIWSLRLDAGARFVLPPAKDADTVRTLYLFDGAGATIGARSIGPRTGMVVRCDDDLVVEASRGPVELLVLQGKPIGEPVVQYGPFVMNDRMGIQRAVEDYQRTGFGGWPWKADDPVHGGSSLRFARRPDGSLESAPEPATA